MRSRLSVIKRLITAHGMLDMTCALLPGQWRERNDGLIVSRHGAAETDIYCRPATRVGRYSAKMLGRLVALPLHFVRDMLIPRRSAAGGARITVPISCSPAPASNRRRRPCARIIAR